MTVPGMGRHLRWVALCVLLIDGLCNHQQTNAFVPTTTTTGWTLGARPTLRCPDTTLHMAGFGASSDSGKKKKETKLKPKAQWDRYIDLKGATMVQVAVRVSSQSGGPEQDWLEVGRVRSKDDAFTEVAVARQRALIADHARRLFPLQVTVKDTLQWAYRMQDEEEWTVVDPKSVAVEEGVEKSIGFEGRPDPATGFYCHYNEGRLVDSEKSKQGPPQ